MKECVWCIEWDKLTEFPDSILIETLTGEGLKLWPHYILELKIKVKQLLYAVLSHVNDNENMGTKKILSLLKCSWSKFNGHAQPCNTEMFKWSKNCGRCTSLWPLLSLKDWNLDYWLHKTFTFSRLFDTFEFNWTRIISEALIGLDSQPHIAFDPEPPSAPIEPPAPSVEPEPLEEDVSTGMEAVPGTS
jgi:hypothetical protein